MIDSSDLADDATIPVVAIAGIHVGVPRGS
jgi:hypothetical protein